MCLRRGHTRRGEVGSVWPWVPPLASDLVKFWPGTPPSHLSVQISEYFWCQYFWTATSNMFVRGYVVLAQGPYEARRRRLGVAMGPSPRV